ncbi:phosphopantetheine-containing protein [Frankia torreyi]|uniref:Phosphopantetheine-containing protein n=1 Tax=Frankia torreyi TaxID=1856 RepID=A0A0D8BBG8_9ACTN|nr:MULTISPECIES: acyl carrier protein [Frankia]KJE21279.1 phosphopantetheine-containing protein [Frankia torreyi]KQM03334.1 phosphopantetheine-containing protein [Frankia sp. CpI1-P]
MLDIHFEELLRQHLPFLPADETLHDNTSLREYGLDSLGTVELLSTLEAEYRIRFSEEALTLETFATPALLWRALSTMRSPTG